MKLSLNRGNVFSIGLVLVNIMCIVLAATTEKDDSSSSWGFLKPFKIYINWMVDLAEKRPLIFGAYITVFLVPIAILSAFVCPNTSEYKRLIKEDEEQEKKEAEDLERRAKMAEIWRAMKSPLENGIFKQNAQKKPEPSGSPGLSRARKRKSRLD